MSYIRWQSEACGCIFITFLSGGLFEEGKGWGHWVETYSSHNAVYCHNIIMVIILMPKFQIFMAKVIDKQPMSVKKRTPNNRKKRIGSALPFCKMLFGNFSVTIAQECFVRTDECLFSYTASNNRFV